MLSCNDGSYYLKKKKVYTTECLIKKETKNCIWGIKWNKILSLLTKAGDELFSARNEPAHSSTQVLHLLAKEDDNYFLDFVTHGTKSW